MRQLLREALDEADRLLNAEQTDSDAWYALAPRLHTTCRQLGSVTYCLREWPEPHDADADRDTFPTRGDSRLSRRIVGFWMDADQLNTLYPRQPAQV